ncbi:sulfatase-like hydrolase/transferase [Flammeovirga kamogawensis]|uniref:Sulfatase-like hydrolase/transferase n=1 Tax=Flammeovirga kamogawensis TaxID=373891 RepID=A0ABX8H412_9BACT|nr:sulfatase-like hydrolase/transferase [Flammeovirga kamogawensis]MBB6461709.1 arylsulfatase A-like enzyme [Flammeovirga kamogawensis]QWG10629.1 sulfatase-like hydrolase/transferase [Flammeovirga kamogawensis]TRX63734.1 sulfatase-like hydrolase/transferase [Flammeovirga kamogawensis]
MKKYFVLLMMLGLVPNFIFSQDKRPNIVFLLADDLGYGELGCYGQEVIKTPNLDALAKKGIRFTNFYSGSPVCSPSRAVLMTGVNSSRNAIRGNNGYYIEDDNFERVSLSKEDKTLGEVLKKAGYQTAFIGKWHLGVPEDLSTWAYGRGFDYAIQEQWGISNKGEKFDEQIHWINGRQDSIYYNEKEWDSKDEFRSELAFKYLDTVDKDKPFFLFMSYRAPHAHEFYINNKELYADKGWPAEERRHAAKITLLDKQIGRMLTKLEEMGELENTLIVFTSDNGPTGEHHDYKFFNSNGDLKGYKRDVYEGGVRVPTIMYWPGKTAKGIDNDFIGGGIDFMATFSDVAKIKTPKTNEGISLVPVLKGKKPVDREYLNWEFQRNGRSPKNFRQAVRIGQLKAVRYGVNKPVEIYNLEEDISETKNIAEQYPELVKKVIKIFENEREDSPHYPYGGYPQENN